MPIPRTVDAPASSPRLDRATALDWYRRNRARSAALFAMLDEASYYERPILLRNPIVFYVGHLPGFALNTLVKRGLGRPGIDAHLERVFARGIDPDSESAAHARHGSAWPARDEVERFVRAADEMLEDAIATGPVDVEGVPILDRAEGVYTLLEHEAMHQETLLYMWHRVPLERKRRPAGYAPVLGAAAVRQRPTTVPQGVATLGADRGLTRFGWDNEFDAHRVEVPAFSIDVYKVTNEEYLEFVAEGGYARPEHWRPADWDWRVAHGVEHPLFWERHGGGWFWRGQFDLLPLPLEWPVFVSHAEASAFARWRGRRLPTEAEFHRAAFGTPSGDERAFPWGDRPPTAAHAAIDFETYDPVPVGSRPAGASAWGVEELVGNGWEWTSTVFGPFEGFRPMASYPEYSAEFFDGQHYVLKGASTVTACELARASFRNWFRPNYPYVYATFRTVSGEGR